jgi:hypothetical protein
MRMGKLLWRVMVKRATGMDEAGVPIHAAAGPCGSSPGLGGLLTAVELVEEVGVVLEAHHQVRMVWR